MAAAKGRPGRVRVTPQLVRVADDTQMWADTYERQLDQIASSTHQSPRGLWDEALQECIE